MHEFLSFGGENLHRKELMDKATWHEQVNAEVANAKLANTPLSVIFIDINAFKSINDDLGHVVGDEVINAVGNLVSFVSHELRSDDNNALGRVDKVSHGTNWDNQCHGSGRIGGDEFAILAPVGELGVRGLMERLRKTFQEYVERPDNKEIKNLGVGLAIGAATLNEEMTARDLLSKADEAMYQDKLEQLPKLNADQEAFVQETIANLQKLGIRPRDLEKHLRRQRRNS